MTQDHVDQLADQWRRERPDLDLSILRVAARIVRLDRFIERAVAEHLEPLGLNDGEFNVLAALRRAGAPYELTPTDLYRSLLLSSGAMTNRLDRLEEAGLIRRTPDEKDRRRIQVALTDEGLARIDAAMTTHTRRLDELLGFLTEGQRQQLEDLLRTALAGIEDREQP